MGAAKGVTITREKAMGVYCPECEAGPWERCKDRNGVARQGVHLERFLVIERDSRLTQLDIFSGLAESGAAPDLFGVLESLAVEKSQDGLDI